MLLSHTLHILQPLYINIIIIGRGGVSPSILVQQVFGVYNAVTVISISSSQVINDIVSADIALGRVPGKEKNTCRGAMPLHHDENLAISDWFFYYRVQEFIIFSVFCFSYYDSRIMYVCQQHHCIYHHCSLNLLNSTIIYVCLSTKYLK